MKSGGTIVALFSAVVSAVLFAVYFFYWTTLPDYVWEIAVSSALAALLLGLWMSVRRRRERLSQIGALVAVFIGLLVLGYVALIVLTYGD